MSCPDISQDEYIGMALEGSSEPYTQRKNFLMLIKKCGAKIGAKLADKHPVTCAPDADITKMIQ